MSPKIALSGFAFDDYSPEDLLSFACDLGVVGIDYWPWNRGSHPIGTYRRLLDHAGMSVCCVNVPSGEIRLGGTERPEVSRRLVVGAMDDAVALGAPAVQVYCATPDVRTRAEAVAILADRLAPLLDEARDRGLTVLVENNLDQRREDGHGVNPSRSVESLVALARRTGSDGLRICYDPANFVTVGEPAFPEAYERLRDHIGAVHAKDCVRFDETRRDDPAANRLLVDGLEGPFLPVVVGAGAVGWPALIGRLAADGYDGWLVLDPFIDPELLALWCETSMDAIRRLIAAAYGAETSDD
ncbi:sugar phosphate isomerase/epimerase family protein [Micromonospora craniellae]|uniref:sugar phosphate isomerase/epimerase family protein n=1 Tax=Micromonospora craniellae TaxID=2294034 RepID=UPI0013143210|nr:sugar phosphate isomerase/epimerase family protein [Micromonospora craniellae]QOC92295.1 TIM barrel protein [Micromonospora craniellae]